MNKVASFFINAIFFIAVVALAVGISTFALTKKVNEFESTQNLDISGVVVKNELPILAPNSGVVEEVTIQEGDKVKKGNVVVEVINPVLADRVEALKEYPDNLSAKTEAEVAQKELDNLNISSPTDGVVAGVAITEGSPVDALEKIGSVFSSSNARFLVEATYPQFRLLQDKKQITVYSRRLNQSFIVKRDILKPEEKKEKNSTDKKIGIYFTFSNPDDVNALLNNEDLIVMIEPEKPTNNNKPIDLFFNFWNNLLSRETTSS